MKDLFTNKNEFDCDGRTYLKKIRSCRIKCKTEKGYVIECDIYMRGSHKYIFDETDDYITKEKSDQKLWLTERAKKKLLRSVDRVKDYLLPKLPKEFNKEYVVDEDTIDKVFLSKSGYSIESSRIYRYKEPNTTSAKWRLNPYTRHVKCWADSNEKSMAFFEYLKIVRNEIEF